MANLRALVVLLLIGATALVSTSAYSMEESCEREMPMRRCMMYMQSRMRSPYRRGFKEEQLRQCCSELKQFSSECRCDAVSEMMKEMRRFGRMEEMERMACKLPRMCGMSDCGCSSYAA